jgi:uncharacterized protein YbbK (DUF523 family)
MTDPNFFDSLRVPEKDNPLRILMSACLAGTLCGYDGSANGEYPAALKLLKYDNVRIIRFCPEHFAFGTPREMCDIHGGNGLDVLEGRAKVLTESGKDWTAEMIMAAEKMLEIARLEKIELAVLMDISAACGSRVIYSGNRFTANKVYQIGSGVCAALLIANGFKVISQRDFASLELLYQKIEPGHLINTSAKDHHETTWFKEYFQVQNR